MRVLRPDHPGRKHQIQLHGRIIQKNVFQKTVSIFQCAVVDQNAACGFPESLFHAPALARHGPFVQDQLSGETVRSGIPDGDARRDRLKSAAVLQRKLAERSSVPQKTETGIHPFSGIHAPDHEIQRDFRIQIRKGGRFDLPENQRRRRLQNGRYRHKQNPHP